MTTKFWEGGYLHRIQMKPFSRKRSDGKVALAFLCDLFGIEWSFQRRIVTCKWEIKGSWLESLGLSSFICWKDSGWDFKLPALIVQDGFFLFISKKAPSKYLETVGFLHSVDGFLVGKGNDLYNIITYHPQPARFFLHQGYEGEKTALNALPVTPSVGGSPTSSQWV